MNGCQEYQELISRMLDEDLSKAERDALAEHIKRCPDCAAVYVAFRSLSESLSEDLVEPSPGLHEKIMADVRREAMRTRNAAHHHHRRWHTVMTAAACLLLVVAAAMSFPKIVGRKGAQQAPAAVSQEMVLTGAAEAEEPMADQAVSADEKGGGFLMQAAPNAMPGEDSVEEEAIEEAPAQECEPADVYSRFMRADGVFVLNDEASAALEKLLTGEKIALNDDGGREFRLIYRHHAEERALTVRLDGGRVAYQMENDENWYRLDIGAEEWLERLGLPAE
ncbi:MAG: zf-HC2 domain-containing protein [Oscillospiraceae bacterium]|nr:zf-HC2 domain-containing protein [Oscillospiraceae bacterium]